MMKNVSVQWFESGLIISQEGVSECVVVSNLLKENFYETLLTACLTGGQVSWSDLDGNRLLLNYEYKNKFNVFINGMYVGDLPFITMSNNTVAIPLDTTDEETLYEVFTSDYGMTDCYLLYQSELF